ncbi:hypothetical protein D3C83_216900 [compost metagenome]
MPAERWFAFTTMTAAFHRTNARMRRSIASSPGNHACSRAGIVLMYGVDTIAGTPARR